MAEKNVVFSKQTGEPPIPITARIEWLPDGTIRPLRYWTPDGACFEIVHVHEMTPLAFLKDRGEGIRFKVIAELIETPEFDGERLHAQHEAYLYFVDNWFYGKNFVDARYGHAGKEYIPVTLDVFPDGDYELVYFKVHDARYMVEKTVEIEPRGSFHAGGVGIRHKVEARLINADDDEDPTPNKTVSRIAAIYFEVNKWFVSVKTAG